eukprot:565137-Prymnesium_polylepis.1
MSDLLLRTSTPNCDATTRGFVLSDAFCVTGVYAPGPGVPVLREGTDLIVFGPVPPNATVGARTAAIRSDGL